NVVRKGPAPSSQSAGWLSSYSQSSSHSRSVLSSLPERTKRPSALHDTELTLFVWPSKERRHLPLPPSHNLSVTPPERAKRPSGLHATAVTVSVCHSKEWCTLPLHTSQRSSVWSS